jgi:hypothetical protein
MLRPIAVANQEIALGLTGTIETPNTAAIIMGPRITSHWGMAFIPVALPNRRCIHKKGTTRISSVPSAQIMTAIHMALLMGGSSVVGT